MGGFFIMTTSTIPQAVKEACNLYENILSAVALTDIYSAEAKEKVAHEIAHLLTYEEPGSPSRLVYEAYMQLLKS